MDEPALIQTFLQSSPVVGVLLVVLYWARGELRSARAEAAAIYLVHRAETAAQHLVQREELAIHIGRMEARDGLLLDLVSANTAALESIEGSLSHLSDISDIRTLLRREAGNG